tara:strand:- start:132 stop:578 length:447 start_codon:yes stop_codon:yes gene_type:complete
MSRRQSSFSQRRKPRRGTRRSRSVKGKSNPQHMRGTTSSTYRSTSNLFEDDDFDKNEVKKAILHLSTNPVHLENFVKYVEKQFTIMKRIIDTFPIEFLDKIPSELGEQIRELRKRETRTLPIQTKLENEARALQQQVQIERQTMKRDI